MDDDLQRLDMWHLRRDRDDRVLGGVCSAVAGRLGIDVLLVRVATGLLGLGGGVGFVLYAWAWLVLPQAGSRTSLLERWFPESSLWSRPTQIKVGAGAALLCAIVLGLVLPWSLGPTFVLVALVLIGRLHQQRQESDALYAAQAAPAIVPGSAFEKAVAAWHARLDGVRPGVDLAALPAPLVVPALARSTGAHVAVPVSSMTTPSRPGKGSRLAAWGAGIGIIALGSLAGASVQTQMGGPRGQLYGASTLLTVLVLGLLVAAVRRRRRPRLVLPVMIIVAIVLACTPWTRDGVNATVARYVITSPSEVPASPVRLNGSRITYDLSRLDATGPTRLALEPNGSNLTVIVPREADVHVAYSLYGGVLDIEGTDGRQENLAGAMTGTWPTEPSRSAPTGDRIDLDLTARAATVVVRRA